MLSNYTVNACIPLAQALIEKNLRVVSRGDTPLAKLVNSTSGVELRNIAHNDNTEITLVDLATSIQSLSCHEYEGVINEHNLVFDEMVPAISAAVRAHVAYARNVVNPFFQRLAEESAEIVKGFVPSALSNMQVNIFQQPLPLLNAVLEASVEKYKDEPVHGDRQFNILMPDLTEDEILKAIVTGGPSVEKDITTWIASQKPSDILVWYASFFTGAPGSVRPASLSDFLYETSSVGRVLNLDKLLFIHLMARHFETNIPSGLSIPLSQYENTFADLRTSTGALLNLEIVRYGKEVVNERRLVRSVVGTTVTVYQDNYNRFLADEGGSNEVLFGMILGKDLSTHVSDIVSKKETYLKHWQRHSALVQMSEQNNRYTRTREALRSVFVRELEEDTEVGLNKADILKKFDEFLEYSTESDFNNLYIFALKAVCASRFAHTDALEILESIQCAVKENPNLDIREAASLAMVGYVTRWVMDQFTIM